MERITKKHLDSRIELLNEITGQPMEAYAKDDAGECLRINGCLVSCSGHYLLNWAYGAVGVDQMSSGGGARDILPLGTKRETYERLNALIDGIRIGQQTAPPVHIVAAAPHDRNGNPRRVSVQISPTRGIIETADHGYRGAPKHYSYEAMRVHVSATEYKELVAMPRGEA
tara:strand:+ start:122 stop:631 length:510 start_codon:yes stop_codon:yes gene_type:complete